MTRSGSHSFLHYFLTAFLCIGLVIPARSPAADPATSLRMKDGDHEGNDMLIRGLRLGSGLFNTARMEFLFSTKAKRLQSPDEDIVLNQVKYFLAALTLPAEDLWVNLSPYERDRILPEHLGRTQLGRDLLLMDCELKQTTTRALHPRHPSGRRFWRAVYERMYKEYGTTDVPLDNVNKVWIVPEEAEVVETDGTAVITRARLKVVLDEDHVAVKRQKHSDATPDWVKSKMREIIVPMLERRVNEGDEFLSLRRAYHAIILAGWFKEALKGHILNRIYAGRSKTGGLIITEDEVDRIYQDYLDLYKNRLNGIVLAEEDPLTQGTVIRRYMIGGTNFSKVPLRRRRGAITKSLLATTVVAVAVGFGVWGAKNHMLRDWFDPSFIARFLNGGTKAEIQAWLNEQASYGISEAEFDKLWRENPDVFPWLSRHWRDYAERQKLSVILEDAVLMANNPIRQAPVGETIFIVLRYLMDGEPDGDPIGRIYRRRRDLKDFFAAHGVSWNSVLSEIVWARISESARISEPVRFYIDLLESHDDIIRYMMFAHRMLTQFVKTDIPVDEFVKINHDLFISFFRIIQKNHIPFPFARHENSLRELLIEWDRRGIIDLRDLILDAFKNSYKMGPMTPWDIILVNVTGLLDAYKNIETVRRIIDVFGEDMVFRDSNINNIKSLISLHRFMIDFDRLKRARTPVLVVLERYLNPKALVWLNLEMFKKINGSVFAFGYHPNAYADAMKRFDTQVLSEILALFGSEGREADSRAPQVAPTTLHPQTVLDLMLLIHEQNEDKTSVDGIADIRANIRQLKERMGGEMWSVFVRKRKIDWAIFKSPDLSDRWEKAAAVLGEQRLRRLVAYGLNAEFILFRPDQDAALFNLDYQTLKANLDHLAGQVGLSREELLQHYASWFSENALLSHDLIRFLFFLMNHPLDSNMQTLVRLFGVENTKWIILNHPYLLQRTASLRVSERPFVPDPEVLLKDPLGFLQHQHLFGFIVMPDTTEIKHRDPRRYDVLTKNLLAATKSLIKLGLPVDQKRLSLVLFQAFFTAAIDSEISLVVNADSTFRFHPQLLDDPMTFVHEVMHNLLPAVHFDERPDELAFHEFMADLGAFAVMEAWDDEEAARAVGRLRHKLYSRLGDEGLFFEEEPHIVARAQLEHIRKALFDAGQRLSYRALLRSAYDVMARKREFGNFKDFVWRLLEQYHHRMRGAASPRVLSDRDGRLDVTRSDGPVLTAPEMSDFLSRLDRESLPMRPTGANESDPSQERSRPSLRRRKRNNHRQTGSVSPPGGVDFRPRNWALKRVRREGMIPLDRRTPDDDPLPDVQGLVPVILDISPVMSLQQILSAKAQGRSYPDGPA